jgi:hypothetical protein
MRIPGGNPAVTAVGGISVVASDPDITAFIPFVMPGNPDSGGMGTFPAVIIFPIRRRGLEPNTDGKTRFSGCGAHSHKREESGEEQITVGGCFHRVSNPDLALILAFPPWGVIPNRAHHPFCA